MTRLSWLSLVGVVIAGALALSIVVDAPERQRRTVQRQAAIMAEPINMRPATVSGARRHISVDIVRQLPNLGVAIVGGASHRIDQRVLRPGEIAVDQITFTNRGEWTWGFDPNLSYRHYTTQLENLELGPDWRIEDTRTCSIFGDCVIYNLVYEPERGMPPFSQTTIKLRFAAKTAPYQRVGDDYVRTDVIVPANHATWGMYSVTSLAMR